ncbi:hypothetical protein Pint_04759 [Pistacia integerrima]|uniref:Uncharacterized protein n=1 Tax=Pistacia integerrima TaxID=434235 RepID=A0ACC0ZA18_9ROSI|nr:hypothetical protein Pint_04759 [Pistacia integerrima]
MKLLVAFNMELEELNYLQPGKQNRVLSYVLHIHEGNIIADVRAKNWHGFWIYRVIDLSLSFAGGYDERLRENVEYLEELKRFAVNNKVADRVNFVTSCLTAERNALLSECLCVLYTPQDEHFGIVPLEAMASHKPVIACNSGGPVETIKNGVTGFLCNPTPQAFALAMGSLIKDPQLAKTMGEEARRHVTENFSTKTFGQRLNRFIIDIVGSKED